MQLRCKQRGINIPQVTYNPYDASLSNHISCAQGGLVSMEELMQQRWLTVVPLGDHFDLQKRFELLHKKLTFTSMIELLFDDMNYRPKTAKFEKLIEARKESISKMDAVGKTYGGNADGKKLLLILVEDKSNCNFLKQHYVNIGYTRLINESGLRCVWIRLVANTNTKTGGKDKSVSLGMDDGDDTENLDCVMESNNSSNSGKNTDNDDSDSNVLVEMNEEYSTQAQTWDVSALKSQQLNVWKQTLAVNDPQLIKDIYQRLTGKEPPTVPGSVPLTSKTASFTAITPPKLRKSRESRLTEQVTQSQPHLGRKSRATKLQSKTQIQRRLFTPQTKIDQLREKRRLAGYGYSPPYQSQPHSRNSQHLGNSINSYKSRNSRGVSKRLSFSSQSVNISMDNFIPSHQEEINAIDNEYQRNDRKQYLFMTYKSLENRNELIATTLKSVYKSDWIPDTSQSPGAEQECPPSNQTAHTGDIWSSTDGTASLVIFKHTDGKLNELLLTDMKRRWLSDGKKYSMSTENLLNKSILKRRVAIGKNEIDWAIGKVFPSGNPVAVVFDDKNNNDSNITIIDIQGGTSACHKEVVADFFCILTNKSDTVIKRKDGEDYAGLPVGYNEVRETDTMIFPAYAENVEVKKVLDQDNFTIVRIDDDNKEVGGEYAANRELLKNHALFTYTRDDSNEMQAIPSSRRGIYGFRTKYVLEYIVDTHQKLLQHLHGLWVKNKMQQKQDKHKKLLRGGKFKTEEEWNTAMEEVYGEFFRPSKKDFSSHPRGLEAMKTWFTRTDGDSSDEESIQSRYKCGNGDISPELLNKCPDWMPIHYYEAVYLAALTNPVSSFLKSDNDNNDNNDDDDDDDDDDPDDDNNDEDDEDFRRENDKMQLRANSIMNSSSSVHSNTTVSTAINSNESNNHGAESHELQDSQQQDVPQWMQVTLESEAWAGTTVNTEDDNEHELPKLNEQGHHGKPGYKTIKYGHLETARPYGPNGRQVIESQMKKFGESFNYDLLNSNLIRLHDESDLYYAQHFAYYQSVLGYNEREEQYNLIQSTKLI